MKSYLLMSFFMSIGILGCAQTIAVKESKDMPATKYDVGQNTDLNTSRSWIPCQDSNATQNIPNSRATNLIDGNNLFITTSQSQRVSLCQVLMSSQKNVAIFQFAGLLCQSCQDEARWLQTQNMQSFSHYLVITDARDEITSQDMLHFQSIAPQSHFFFDHDKITINDLNPGKIFGTVLVLHRSGEYRLHLSPGLEKVWYQDALNLSTRPIGSNYHPQNNHYPQYNFGFEY